MKHNKTKEDYEFLKDYHESNLIFIKEFLQNSESLSNHPIYKAIDEELDRRKGVTESFIDKFKEKYLNQYIRYNLKDGLGSYIVLKVSNIGKTYNSYINFYYSVNVSNIDGKYSINDYKDGRIQLYSELEETKIEIITKEEYKKEFDKAIEFYKQLEE